jgi:transcriptional regulator with GAF, ATPase, and Fis domain
MSERFALLNDDRLTTIRPIITARLQEAAGLVGGGAFEEFFDGTMQALLRDGLNRIDAHEGTVWLLDPTRTFLMPRFNTGPNSSEFVGRFRQSLRSGMISMVVATEQPICENDVQKNQQQDKTLDRQLGLLTCAMIAVPFYFTGEMRGVVSAVRLKAAGAADEPAGFRLEDLEALQLTTTVLTRMIEYRLLSLVLGREGLG